MDERTEKIEIKWAAEGKGFYVISHLNKKNVEVKKMLKKRKGFLGQIYTYFSDNTKSKSSAIEIHENYLDKFWKLGGMKKGEVFALLELPPEWFCR